MPKVKTLLAKSVKEIAHTVIRNNTIRKLALKKAVGEVYKKLIFEESDIYPLKEQQDKFYMASALLHSIDRAMSNNISPQCRNALINILAGKVLSAGDLDTKEKFNKEFGHDPPNFLTISSY